jgi:hypothetical protein
VIKELIEHLSWEKVWHGSVPVPFFHLKNSPLHRCFVGISNFVGGISVEKFIGISNFVGGISNFVGGIFIEKFIAIAVFHKSMS